MQQNAALPNDWVGLHEANFRIADTYAHHHADSFMGKHPWIQENLNAVVGGMSDLVCTKRGRKKEPRGAEPDYFNKALRKQFAETTGWSYEATILDGVIMDNETWISSKTEGFDLAMYDAEANLGRLWNLCFGRRGLSGGESYWAEAVASRNHWQDAAGRVDLAIHPRGSDREITAKSPTILGEIQCGNWALVYRDFLKVLDASKQTDVDFYLYIAPTGNLSNFMSDGTVNFRNTVEILKKFSAVMTIPTYVVGIDVEVGARIGDIPEDLERLMATRVARQGIEAPLQRTL